MVAEEIRKLAADTAGSVKRIRDLIGKIQSGISEGVEITEVSYKEMSKSREISNRVKAALGEISKLVGQMAGMAGVISEVSRQQSDLIKSTFKDITDVSLISQNNASACQETSSSIEEQTASMQEIASTSQGLFRYVLELKDLLAKIKV